VIVHGRESTRRISGGRRDRKRGAPTRFVGGPGKKLGEEPQENSAACREAGDVDILVNNAGFPWFRPTSKLDAKTLDQLFAATVQAPTCWCRYWPRKWWPAATA